MPSHFILTFALLVTGVFALFVLAGRLDKVHGGTWNAGFRFAWMMAKVIIPFLAIAVIVWLTQQ